MTIAEAIAAADELAVNGCTQVQKLGWLTELDGRVKLEVFDTHEGEVLEMPDYSELTDTGTALLAPAPFDRMYVPYLEAHYHYVNADIDRFNNANALFLAKYQEFVNFWNRTHMPKSGALRFFIGQAQKSEVFG